MMQQSAALSLAKQCWADGSAIDPQHLGIGLLALRIAPGDRLGFKDKVVRMV